MCKEQNFQIMYDLDTSNPTYRYLCYLAYLAYLALALVTFLILPTPARPFFFL